MKRLKTFESISNYNVDIFTIIEAEDLYQNILKKNKFKYYLKDKIHYYSNGDFSTMFASDHYIESCRFFIAYTDKDILGICKFANWDSTGHYAVSYLSTNKDFYSMGISKKLLDVFFKYFSKTYPNETLHFSGYSVEGWNFLHKNILEFSKKYNVKIREKGVEYPGKDGKHDDNYWKLTDKSREEIKNLYGSEDTYY